MITICLSEMMYDHDIYSLVRAFYPGEEVKVIADREKIEELEEKEAPLFHMEVLFEREENQIEVVFKGETRKIAVDFSDRKRTKDGLKRELYGILSNETKRRLPWGTLTGIRPTKIPMQLLDEGCTEDEIREYMMKNYQCSSEKTQLSISIAQRERRLLEKLDYERGYSLYIGIPFCPSTCLYCSFTSYPLAAWKDRVDEYLDALEKEIDFTARSCKEKYLNTVYIGGGTPTTLTAGQLDRLLSKICSAFDLSHLLEFTVEAGRPDSITREKMEVLRKYGISRISINPQTMNQKTLDLIGRHHTVEQTVESFRMARACGFDNINMDLIVGLPGEELEDVHHTLEALRGLQPDNLTVHSLALKRAARLNLLKDEYRDYKMENTPEHIALTAKYCKEMGLEPYYLYRQKNMAGNFENVGYALEGKAGIYNILIMEEKQTIMALGAGAATRLVPGRKMQVERVENVKDVSHYLARVDEMIERKRRKMEEVQWP